VLDPAKKQSGFVMALLTQREREVLRLLLDGKSDGDIAPQLGISAKTVSFHVENAKRKLGASHRVRAVALALRDGLIAFPDDGSSSGAASAPGAVGQFHPMRPRGPLAGTTTEVALIARVQGRSPAHRAIPPCAHCQA
jgi:DNA-binding CsgD family transcriptional regulator